MKTKTLLTLPMLRGITRHQRERPMFLSQDIIQKMRNSPSLYKHGLFRRKIVRGGTSADKTRRKIVRGGTSADKNMVKIVRGGTSADKNTVKIVRAGTSADKKAVKIVRAGTSADKSVAR